MIDESVCLECGNTLDSPEQKCEKCGANPRVVIINKKEYLVLTALTAQLDKDEGQKKFNYRVGNLWDLDTDVATEFINRIEKKFIRKQKFHCYLNKNNLPNSIPTLLTRHINKNIVFFNLCSTIMEKIKESANDSGSLSRLKGGSIVFLNYKTCEDGDRGKLLITMLDKYSGFDFDSTDLTPEKYNLINIDALRQAAMFDLTLFEAVYPINDDDLYVHFIEGKSQSDFVKVALGCQLGNDNKRSIEQLFSAINSFVIQHKLGRIIRDAIDSNVKEFLDKKARNKQGIKIVKLSEISEIIDKHLPNECTYKGTFSDFVNINGYQVDQQFEPTHQSATNALSIEINDRDNNFKLKIMRGAIGDEKSNKPVVITDRKGEVVIKLSDEDYNDLIKYRDYPNEHE